MDREDLQDKRKKTWRTLDRLIRDGYSSLTCYEYYMLQVARDYIYMKYKESKQ